VSNDNRNFITFAIIAALILFGWPLIASRFFPTSPPATKIEGGKTIAQPTPGSSPAAADATTVLRDRAAVMKDSPRVQIVTPQLRGSINLKGARIDDLVLNQYKETVDKNSPPVRLLSPSGAKDAYFAGFGWTGDAASIPGPDTVFTASAPTLTPEKPVTLSWTNPTGQKFVIRVAVDDHFMFTIDQGVFNNGTAPVSTRAYSLISRTGVPTDIDAWTNHIGPIGVFGRGADYSITYDNLRGKETSFFGKIWGSSGRPGDNYFDTTGGWAGFGDRFWLAALIPDQNAPVHSGFRKATDDRFQTDVARAPVVVAPGKNNVTTTRLFAGAKEVNTIDRYEDDLKIPLFGRAIDWGWFEIVEKPIFKYLDFLFRLVGNFGVAIILLTLTIRGLLFPIAHRQFKSMAQMRAIQPKMKALQEKHKDDKQRQQQEVMALYKAEGVNPLAGCAPTLLQIPIMYSLYKVLLVTIEMRHQPFFGWIKDLSAPDPLTPVNLFGLLSFTPPHFLAIGVVPILLGVSMWLQFKMNPQPMDDAQKQVFALMPWVLMFVMAPFAVGLQVYWITSNLLTVLQQRILYSRHPVLKEAVAK
jgi:YidC/Oxa1 family membrane protein insertase